MKKQDTSWGGVASWYDEHLSRDDDSYHQKVLLPNMIRLMAITAQDKVLDLACGTGFFTREYAKNTEHVIGVDVSSELIEIAQKNSPPHVRYIISSANDLSSIASASINKISFVLAIQNIDEIKAVLMECNRVLVSGGTVHIVMNHPAFRIPKASAWGWDDASSVQYRRIDSYLSQSRVFIDMHPGKKEKIETISFHRPLQFYVKAFTSAGFVLTRLEEWISHKKSASGVRQKEEDRMRKEIPLFLYTEIRKN